MAWILGGFAVGAAAEVVKYFTNSALARHLGVAGLVSGVSDVTLRLALERNDDLIGKGDAVLLVAVRSILEKRRHLEYSTGHDMLNRDAVAAYFDSLAIEKFFPGYEPQVRKPGGLQDKANLFKAIVGAIAKDLGADFAEKWAKETIKSAKY